MLFLAIIDYGDPILEKGESDGVHSPGDVLSQATRRASAELDLGSLFGITFRRSNLELNSPWESRIILILQEAPEQRRVTTIVLYRSDTFRKSLHASRAALECLGDVVVPGRKIQVSSTIRISGEATRSQEKQFDDVQTCTCITHIG